MNSEDDTLKVAGVIALGVSFIVLIPVNCFLDAWVCLKLWNWFLLKPTGFAVPMSAFFGLCLLIPIMRPVAYRPDPKNKTLGQKFGELCGIMILGPLVALTMGYIGHLVVG